MSEPQTQTEDGQRLRILVVTEHFWPEYFRMTDLADVLAARGHDITVLTCLPNYPKGEFFPGYGNLRGPWRQQRGAIQIFRVPTIRRRRGTPLQLMFNFASFPVFGSFLGPLLLRKRRFDLIFVWDSSPITVAIPAILLKKLRGIPIAMWVQDLWPDSLSATGAIRSRRVISAVGSLVRFIHRQCELLLMQSLAFRDSMRTFGAAEECIEYLPNWSETFFEPVVVPDHAKERQEMPAGFRVMFAGNIGAAQSFETIIEAAETLRHDDIQFVILGDGRLRGEVEKMVRERGLANVHLLGFRPPETMPSYLALADVLLVTLRREPIFALTIPSKVQAYLASSKPIVAALDGEGARVIEEARAGVVVPAEDGKALAEAIVRIRRMSADERQQMGERGRQYARAHFDRDTLISRLEGMLWDVVTRNRKHENEPLHAAGKG